MSPLHVVRASLQVWRCLDGPGDDVAGELQSRQVLTGAVEVYRNKQTGRLSARHLQPEIVKMQWRVNTGKGGEGWSCEALRVVVGRQELLRPMHK
jgi:hypothetical protein